MANLIITVIAIALIAIASMMGVYYGGAAYVNSQSAANASTVLNQAYQLAGAWNAYLGDNINTVPSSLSDLTNPNNVIVQGAYLKQVPIAPRAPGNITSFPFFVAQTGVHYYAYADVGAPSSATLAGQSADPNAIGCFRIQKTATGTQPATINSAGQGALAALGNGTYGCGILTGTITNGLGGATVPTGDLNTGDYVFEYLLQ